MTRVLLGPGFQRQALSITFYIAFILLADKGLSGSHLCRHLQYSSYRAGDAARLLFNRRISALANQGINLSSGNRRSTADLLMASALVYTLRFDSISHSVSRYALKCAEMEEWRLGHLTDCLIPPPPKLTNRR
jgi:hypothetical protein